MARSKVRKRKIVFISSVGVQVCREEGGENKDRNNTDIEYSYQLAGFFNMLFHRRVYGKVNGMIPSSRIKSVDWIGPGGKVIKDGVVVITQDLNGNTFYDGRPAETYRARVQDYESQINELQNVNASMAERLDVSTSRDKFEDSQLHFAKTASE